MAPVAILVWGSGFFARKWLETLKGREDCRVAGIVSRSPEGLGTLRRELDLPGVPGFRTLEEAVAAGGAGAVLVALPEMLHRAAIVAALGAGLHVLAEKPLATTAEEARAIHAAARARPDRVVMVCQNFRWRPHTRALRRAIREGAIGRLGHVMLECRQQIRRTTVEGWRERMADPFLLDFAIHHLDLIRYLTGEEAREVLGVSFRPAWSWYAGDTAACAILTMESGLVVGYDATMVAQGLETPQEGLITLIGERGSLHLDGRSQVSLLGAGDPRPVPADPAPEGELGHGLARFVEAVRGGPAPETHLDDNLRSFGLLLALMESRRTRRAVRPADVLSLP
jgi:predicted dehydrogenase